MRSSNGLPVAAGDTAQQRDRRIAEPAFELGDITFGDSRSAAQGLARHAAQRTHPAHPLAELDEKGVVALARLGRARRFVRGFLRAARSVEAPASPRRFGVELVERVEVLSGLPVMRFSDIMHYNCKGRSSSTGHKYFCHPGPGRSCGSCNIVHVVELGRETNGRGRAQIGQWPRSHRILDRAAAIQALEIVGRRRDRQRSSWMWTRMAGSSRAISSS